MTIRKLVGSLLIAVALAFIGVGASGLVTHPAGVNVAYAQGGNLPTCSDATTSAQRGCSLAERISDPNGFVYTSWKILRGTINILLIIALLAISFSNITHNFFGLNLESYTAKKALPNLLLGIILANASLFIIRYLADISTVAVYFFVEQTAFKTFQEFIAFTISLIGINTILTIGTAAGAISTLIGLLLMIVALVGTLWLAFLLYIRLVAIYLLTILSPLAFVSYGIPGFDKYFKMWWQQFIKWLFILPAMSAVFWLMIVIGSDGNGRITSNQSVALTILLYVLFFTAMTLPSKMGGVAIDKASNFFKNNPLSKAATKATVDYASQKGQQIGYRMPGVARYQAWREQQKVNAQKDIDQLKKRGKVKVMRGKTGLNTQKLEILEKELASQEADINAQKALAAGGLKDSKGNTLTEREIKADYSKQKAEAHRDADLAKEKLRYLDDKKNAEELNKIFDKLNESTVYSGEAGKQEGIKKGNLAREELILAKHVENFRKAEELEAKAAAGQPITASEQAIINKKGEFEADYIRVLTANPAGHEYFSGKTIKQAASAVGVDKSIIGAKKSQSAKAVDAGVKATIEEALKNETLEEAVSSYNEIKEPERIQLTKGDTRGMSMKDQHVFVSHTQKLVSWANRQNDHRRDGSLVELGDMAITAKGPIDLGGGKIINDRTELEDYVRDPGTKNEAKRALLRKIADTHPFLVGSGGYQAGHFD